MNTEKIAVLTCLLSLSGLSVRAQHINWDSNPLNDLQVALAGQKTVVPVAQARLVAVKDMPAAAPTVNLEGKALGSTVVGNDRHAYNDKVTLMLNDDKTRVGAAFSNCPGPSVDYPTDCDEDVNFVFPQLTVDAKARVIKFGEQIVAHNRAIFGLGGYYSLTNGWRFVISKNRQTIDDGFNRKTVTRVSVSLVK